MLNIRDLRIDPASLGTKKLLVDIIEAREYKDGRRTDTVTGYRYVVALPEHALEKIGVKIDGKQLMDKPDGFAEVEFSGLEVIGNAICVSLKMIYSMFWVSSRLS